MPTKKSKDTVTASGTDELRQRAEEHLKGEKSNNQSPQAEENLLKLLHELQVYQIELEIQNDELRRSEDELRTSRDKFSLLYDFAPMGYFTLDRDGAILSVNLAGTELLGENRSRVANQHFVHFVTLKDRTVFAAFLEKVFEGRMKETCEIKLSRENEKPLYVRLESVSADSGRECLTAVIDITELTQMSNELQQSHDLLEIKIAERTRELEQTIAALQKEITERKSVEQQLFQSQKLEAIGLLAGGISHDFNNLLTAITGYGEVIQDSIPEEDQELRESIGYLLKGAERAAELTRSLLALSRKQILNPRPVLINTIVDEANRLMRRVIGEDIELNTVFPCEKLMVMADVGQIEQVLMNLATNARDAMPQGGRLTFSTRGVVVKEGSEARYDLSAPGKYARLTIEDTGTGIDELSLKRIFEPFYTTKEPGKGTGLGLSIVHGIIKQHGGSIVVKSEPGKGTSFDIYLPISKRCERAEKAEQSAPVAGGTETILIAEDEAIVQFFMKKILEKSGYRVIAASDGAEAVALFREHDDIALVLSDVVMPGKNGKEILAEIRKIKPQTKVIFISGYTADIMHAKGIREEGLEFIMKPISKDVLLQKIREVLDSP